MVEVVVEVVVVLVVTTAAKVVVVVVLEVVRVLWVVETQLIFSPVNSTPLLSRIFPLA